MNAPDTSWAKSVALLDAVADQDNPLFDALDAYRTAERRLERTRQLNAVESNPALEETIERLQLEVRDTKRSALTVAAEHFGEIVSVVPALSAVVQSCSVDWSRSGREAA